MDLLYHRYASPMDLLSFYIRRGRFGEFVRNIIEADYQRRKEEAEKDNEWKLWTMYIHSMYEGSFQEWKNEVCKPARQDKARSRDEDLDEAGINSILDNLFPA